jgi:biopolymer transport protein ExbB/TolQ
MTTIFDYFFEGGWVMWPLAFSAFLLWFCLGYRIFFYAHFKSLIQNENLNIEDQNLFLSQKTKYTTLIKSLLMIAPLLGLLGTVSGMIETFDSMGDMQLYSQDGGIAAGISKALFTTQMGLVISAPGLLFSKYIETRIAKLEIFPEARKG